MSMKSFQTLPQQAKQSWSDDTVAVYDAAASPYAADSNTRVHLGRTLAEART